MLMVLLMLSVCLMICGYLRYKKRGGDTAVVLIILGWIFTLIVIAALLINITGVINGSTLTQKIEMYQTENENIQNEISLIAENYKLFEKEIYQGIKPESPIVLTTLFPELKSDEIVSKQVDIYLANNKAIKKLKKQQIDVSIHKWWIYFG